MVMSGGHGPCPGMVYVRRAWSMSGGHGPCPAGMVYVRRAWSMSGGHGSCPAGMVVRRDSMRDGKYEMYDWESMLADSAYVSVPHCLVAKKGSLTALDRLTNKYINCDRCRIEHVNAFLEVPWLIFNTPWRGSLDVLRALVVLIVHSLAYERSCAPLFEPTVPWGHDPALFI